MAKKKHDREAMKRELKERRAKSSDRKASSGGSFKSFLVCPEDVAIYKPSTDGDDHEIDILTYQAGKRDPLREDGEWTGGLDIFVHQNVGSNNDQFVCPAQDSYEQPCPICECRQELYNEGEKDKANRLWPSRRTVYNILNYDNKEEEEKGVQIFPVAFAYLEEPIAKLVAKAQRRGDKNIDPNIDVADPDNGRTISFNVSKKTITIRDKPVTVPDYSAIELIPRNYKITDEDLDDCYCLDDFIYLGEENEEKDEIDWKAFYKEIDEAFTGGDSEEEKDTDTDKGGRGRSRNRGSEKDEDKKEEATDTDKGSRRRGSKKDKEKEETETNKDSCPGEFAVDVGSFSECENCFDFIKCAKKNKENKKESKKEEEKSTGRGRRSRIK